MKLTALIKKQKFLLPDKIPTPVQSVAIVSSASVLNAIDALFINMLTDIEFAFIGINHLSADYKSLMVGLLSKRTKTKVNRSVNNEKIKPNKDFLAMPKKDITNFHCKLFLNEGDYFKVSETDQNFLFRFRFYQDKFQSC